MVRRPFARIGACLLSLVLLAGCARDATAPVAPTASVPTSSSALLGLPIKLPILLPVLGVTRSAPLSKDIAVTAVIGKAGGTITIPEAGLTLVVPPNAVRSNVTFTATALAGQLVAYDFKPHGMKFDVPLKFQQDLKKTSLITTLTAPLLRGAYFADNSQLNQQKGIAFVNELIPATLDLLRGRIGFGINHFSGYLVSWN